MTRRSGWSSGMKVRLPAVKVSDLLVYVNQKGNRTGPFALSMISPVKYENRSTQTAQAA